MENVELIQKLLESARQLQFGDRNTLDAIKKKAEMVVRKTFGDSSPYIKSLNSIWFSPRVYPSSHERQASAWESGKNQLRNLLQTMIDELTLFDSVKHENVVIKFNTSDVLQLIFERFHLVVRQLRNRYNSRTTLDVNDEYDVQDLLHSILKIYFNDIRCEEWTPSYAGGCKRMDFLLKNEKTVIEVKKTRQNLADKEVGEQLIIDIETYKHHPDCKSLVCFVYDPEGRIGNPVGLENDLARLSENDLSVRVYIFPK